MLTFISGGARSGKSSFAELYALEISQDINNGNHKPLVYIATSERTDQEMEQRINRHIQERSQDWVTVEEPLDITNVLLTIKGQRIILLDCLTVWINNMMYKRKAELPHILREISKLIHISEQKQLHVIVVSNDVNEDIPINNLYVQQYIYQLEKTHSLITAKADTVYQVVGGIPMKWKG